MLLSAEAFWLLIDTLGVMCLLAASYGTVARASREPWRFRWIMGALFGVAAVLGLHDSMRITEGVQIDLRGVPLVLAGAYLGWQGALAAASLTLATRLGIGGIGMLPGCMGILINVGAGLGWSWLMRRPHPRGSQRTRLGARVGLAALSSTYVLTGLLLPSDIALRVVTVAWPILIPLHMAGVVIVATVLEREQALLDAQRRVAQQAVRDPLTKLLNRRGFEAAVVRARPEFTGAALLLLDLDRFKRVNDTHGHAAGDAVLRQLGGRLTHALQGRGVIGRLGGEEVAVFLPSILRSDMKRIAEELRKLVREEPFVLPCGGSLHVTASIGGAWSSCPVDLDALLARADLGLYAAKHGGRDRCCMDGDLPAAAVKLGSVVDLASRDQAPAVQRLNQERSKQALVLHVDQRSAGSLRPIPRRARVRTRNASRLDIH